MCNQEYVSVTMAQYHPDIKITQPFVSRYCMFCADYRPSNQVNVYRTIVPLDNFFIFRFAVAIFDLVQDMAVIFPLP